MSWFISQPSSAVNSDAGHFVGIRHSVSAELAEPLDNVRARAARAVRRCPALAGAAR